MLSSRRWHRARLHNGRGWRSLSWALLVVVGIALFGCVDRTAPLARTELSAVPRDGRMTVVDAEGNVSKVRARRLSVIGRGDVLDDLVRDGIVYTPEDTLRLPASEEDAQAFTRLWLTDPDWSTAELAFAIPEPEVVPWVLAGSVVGGLLVGVATYSLVQCKPSQTASCEDFETTRDFIAVLAGLGGAGVGNGLAYLLYLRSNEPGYRVVW